MKACESRPSIVRWLGLRRLPAVLAVWGMSWSIATPADAAGNQPSGTGPGGATVRVAVERRSEHRIPAFITGKFAEHLGWNIYHGMDAQVLRNPTFAAYPFSTGQTTPDGIATYHWERDRIRDELRRQAARFGWPESALAGLVEGWEDGLAAFWARVGPRGDVAVSPDTAPFGGRAQRIEVTGPGQGVAQWVWLPVHRLRRFEWELHVRSPDLQELQLEVGSDRGGGAGVRIPVPGLRADWTTLRGTFDLPPGAPAEAAFRVALTAGTPGQWVVRHLFVRPADHVHGADPEVIGWLRESRLPILRWPGGNFVSGYHWEDGIGPLERRPTRPNPAWGGLELNTFGTDEFIAFCRAVGCEPMICVNAGDGTPAEAARWIEYCNGPVTSAMGAVRAAHGHPEPYGVRHWEVGNELWGRWQYHWTTPAGNVDRFRRFAAAMRAADPAIVLYACGAPVFWGGAWNEALISGGGAEFRITTDHPLIGGNVVQTVDPLDVFRDFMAVPRELERRWAALRGRMVEAGVREPRLAVTELQVFAHVGPRGEADLPVRLTRESLPAQGSITEAMYDVLIYHACLRLAPFVTMVTHSAVVNHGGGLRKERERTYPNPCHHAQAAFAAFAGATPVEVDVTAGRYPAPRVLPDLRAATAGGSAEVSSLDAFAAVATDGSLLLSLVNCRAEGPLRVEVDLGSFAAGAAAEVRTLSGRSPAEGNTLTAPGTVSPADTVVPVDGGRLIVELPVFAVARVRVPGR